MREVNKKKEIKKEHIRSLLSLENVGIQWRNKYGRDWNENDVETLYVRFEEKLYEVVAGYSVPIEGVVDIVNTLKERGIKIGSTTEYYK